jgi:hypothetical protein
MHKVTGTGVHHGFTNTDKQLHEAFKFSIPYPPSCNKNGRPTQGTKRAKRKFNDYPTFPISKYPTKVHKTPKRKEGKGKEV